MGYYERDETQASGGTHSNISSTTSVLRSKTDSTLCQMTHVVANSPCSRTTPVNVGERKLKCPAPPVTLCWQ